MNEKRKLVRGKDKISAPDRIVSEFDLDAGSPAIAKVLNRLGPEYVLLNLYGFDGTMKFESTGTFYEIHECEHVTDTGQRKFGKRYIGKERLDDEWILNGAPTEAAKAAARQDMSYMRELAELSKHRKVS